MMSKPASRNQLIQNAYYNLTAGGPYADNWICDETILQLIKTRYPKIESAFKYDRRAINRALVKITGAYDSSNLTKVYTSSFETLCPYTNTKRKVYFYYRCTNDEPPSQPSQASDVQDIVAQSKRMQEKRERLSDAERKHYSTDEVTKKIQAVIKDNEKKTAAAKAKAPPKNNNYNNLHAMMDGEELAYFGPTGIGNIDNTKNTYWSCSEARKLFGYDKNDETIDVVHLLNERIELLKSVHNNEHGYQYVIPMSEEESSQSSVTSYNIFVIRHKALFLTRAYQIALDKLKVGVKWEDICNEAVKELNNVGINTTTTGKIVMKWHREFRDNDQFPHPNIYVRMGKTYKPPIFELFPDIEAKVNEFILSNLSFFTVEMLRSELATEIIPKRLAQVLDEDGVESESLGRTLLEAYIEKMPSYSTVLRWVHSMNFTYDTRAKSYMVDGHEHKEQREHRSKHTTEYLTVLETNTFRWVQMTVEEFDQLPYRSEIHSTGYTYTGIDGKPMIELHVDDHEKLQEYANERYEFGGNTSVRINGKPIIIFGQDESIFNQFAFGNRQWVSAKGERAFLPKSDGSGVMVSAFQSRETGFGMEEDKELLARVNEKRRRDGHYLYKKLQLKMFKVIQGNWISPKSHSFESWSMVPVRMGIGLATT